MYNENEDKSPVSARDALHRLMTQNPSNSILKAHETLSSRTNKPYYVVPNSEGNVRNAYEAHFSVTENGVKNQSSEEAKAIKSKGLSKQFNRQFLSVMRLLINHATGLIPSNPSRPEVKWLFDQFLVKAPHEEHLKDAISKAREEIDNNKVVGGKAPTIKLSGRRGSGKSACQNRLYSTKKQFFDGLNILFVRCDASKIYSVILRMLKSSDLVDSAQIKEFIKDEIDFDLYIDLQMLYIVIRYGSISNGSLESRIYQVFIDELEKEFPLKNIYDNNVVNMINKDLDKDQFVQELWEASVFSSNKKREILFEVKRLFDPLYKAINHSGVALLKVIDGIDNIDWFYIAPIGGAEFSIPNTKSAYNAMLLKMGSWIGNERSDPKAKSTIIMYVVRPETAIDLADSDPAHVSGSTGPLEGHTKVDVYEVPIKEIDAHIILEKKLLVLKELLVSLVSDSSTNSLLNFNQVHNGIDVNLSPEDVLKALMYRAKKNVVDQVFSILNSKIVTKPLIESFFSVLLLRTDKRSQQFKEELTGGLQKQNKMRHYDLFNGDIRTHQASTIGHIMYVLEYINESFDKLPKEMDVQEFNSRIYRKRYRDLFLGGYHYAPVSSRFVSGLSLPSRFFHNVFWYDQELEPKRSDIESRWKGLLFMRLYQLLSYSEKNDLCSADYIARSLDMLFNYGENLIHWAIDKGVSQGMISKETRNGKRVLCCTPKFQFCIDLTFSKLDVLYYLSHDTPIRKDYNNFIKAHSDVYRDGRYSSFVRSVLTNSYLLISLLRITETLEYQSISTKFGVSARGDINRPPLISAFKEQQKVFAPSVFAPYRDTLNKQWYSIVRYWSNSFDERHETSLIFPDATYHIERDKSSL